MSKKHQVAFADRVHADEEPQSLLKHLELTGNFKAHSQVQMSLAYKHYVRESLAPREITKLIAVRTDVIEKWVVLFGWDEARAQHQLNKWRQVASIANKKGIDVDARADRIMHTIEGAVEALLHKHHSSEDGILSAKDLATLAACIKTTRGERKEARGEAKEKTVKHHLAVDVVGNVDILHRVGAAIADLTGQNKQIEAARTAAQISLDDHVEDAEYEVLDDD